MKKVLGLLLGLLTAIGGFVDIGDLVVEAEVGSRFGVSLVWVVILGLIGVCIFVQMSGRVTAVSKRATFEIIRERLGPRVGAANLGASFFINLLTLTAEVGGIALSLQLASSIATWFWIPVAAFAVWLVIWKVKFSLLQNVVPLFGLALVGFGVAAFLLMPDWGQLFHQATSPSVPSNEHASTYWYFAVSLFGSAMTPYQVTFYSSGAVEEKWTPKDISRSRLNVVTGYPVGALVSISIAVCATIFLLPHHVNVSSLTQTVLPVAAAGGKLLLAIVILGMVAATFGAALESTLASGYTLAQFFGWTWGKFRKPKEAARFHLTMIICLIIGMAVLLTGVDPVQVTEIAVVFSAIALPLTYLPILIVANDPSYMGKRVNGRVLNGFAMVYLVIVLAASVAGIPLMIITGAGA
ncbi:MAG TPA: divalent metal cation transporter [Microbacteriaceae bacterium]|jgi:Mn2+/Fe2+ NRAMP family transporter|nr:divalent metal cation transporter [Microbacteriaceae bacterium]